MMPWCEDCHSWHAVPRDFEHWKNLQCVRPWEAWEKELSEWPYAPTIVEYGTPVLDFFRPVDPAWKEAVKPALKAIAAAKSAPDEKAQP